MAKKDEVALIEKKVTPLVAKAESHKITDPESMKEATVMLSQMNKFGDTIKEEKEKITKPALAILAAERKRWKPLEDMYARGIDYLRNAMSDYQTEQTRLAAEKAEKIASRVGDGKGKLQAETAVAQIEQIKTPDKEVATDEGLVQFRTVQQFEVMDFSLLPDAYKVVNEVEIRKAMKAGTPIAGVRYFDKQVPANYR